MKEIVDATKQLIQQHLDKYLDLYWYVSRPILTPGQIGYEAQQEQEIKKSIQTSLSMMNGKGDSMLGC